MIDLATLLPPWNIDPESGISKLLAARGLTVDTSRHRVFASRCMAHEVADALPAGEAVLNCEGVHVASPSFIDELRALRPDVRFEAMNEDVAASWEMAEERRHG